MTRPLNWLAMLVLLFIGVNLPAQSKRTSLSLMLGNAPHDFKIGWYDIDHESFDNYDVVQASFSAGLKYQLRLEDNVNFRMRASYLSIYFHEHHEDEFVTRSTKSRQSKLQFAPGIVFSMTEKRLTLFGGFEAVAYFHGRVENKFINIEKRIPQTGDGSNSSTIPRGFTAGVAPLTGFRYQLSKILFCESELSMMFLYGRTGGKTRSAGPVESSTQDSLSGLFTESSARFGVGVRL